MFTLTLSYFHMSPMSMVAPWNLLTYFILILVWWFTNGFSLNKFIYQTELLSIVALMSNPRILIEWSLVESTTRISWTWQWRIWIVVTLKRGISFIFTLYTLHILDNLLISFHIWLSFSYPLRWIVSICIVVWIMVTLWMMLLL